MKQGNVLKLLAAACAVALLACGVSVLFKAVYRDLNYAHAENYTAGGAEIDGAVKNLDIDWIDGAVNIAYHAGNTIGIAETAPRAIPEDRALRWWLDGDTLRIRYAQAGFSLRNLFSFRGMEKALTLTLPEGIALGEVGIEVTSGRVTIPDLRADRVKVDLTSGDLSLRQSGTTGHMALSSTSGNLAVNVCEVGELDIDVTSGNIALEGGAASNTTIGSTSGKVNVALSAFDELQIEVTSGDITAALPSEPGYRADIDTTSGRFDYSVALARDGSAYTCGDGSARLRIETTSGNVRLADVNGR